MAAQVEVPKGKALEDLRRQRAEREQMKLEEKAGAPLGKKKGGSIRGGGCEQRGKTKGRML